MPPLHTLSGRRALWPRDVPYTAVCVPVSPPRVAFTRRVIHLNFDVAPSGETFVSQLLNTWSGVCDVKWLLDRVVQLLREPEPDVVPAAARPEAWMIARRASSAASRKRPLRLG